jgi:hypothetical protein
MPAIERCRPEQIALAVVLKVLHGVRYEIVEFDDFDVFACFHHESFELTAGNDSISANAEKVFDIQRSDRCSGYENDRVTRLMENWAEDIDYFCATALRERNCLHM